VKVEKELYEYRKESGDPELFGFWITRKKDEVWITRARNLVPSRTDGDFAPLEED
jgi:hypothetical protein